jgi:predicted nucleic-acid-binding Zn-ribbon protein
VYQVTNKEVIPMAKPKPKSAEFVPTKCAKCGNEEIKREEFSMHGKLGFMGPDYRFDVYICRNCGHSEFFFQSAKWIR